MPMVDWGKCSAAVLEKDFWSERMRSALEDSRGCCWVLEAVWRCQFEEMRLWGYVWRSVPGTNARLGTTSGLPSRSSGCHPVSCARSQ